MGNLTLSGQNNSRVIKLTSLKSVPIPKPVAQELRDLGSERGGCAGTDILGTTNGISELTLILHRIQQGDAGAAEELLPLVYAELRKLAAGKMARELANQTLQPTALVHEAWLRLGGDAAPAFQNRAHFFGAAAEAMRRILIEGARRRLTAKRGAGAAVVPLDELEIPSPFANDDHLMAVNEALGKFAAIDPRKAELVKLRYFVEMSFEEAASTLGIAVPTAKQWWAYARAWLSVELRSDLGD